MTKATELFKTLDDLKPYVGEVWENDAGVKFTLEDVGIKHVFFRHGNDSPSMLDLVLWLDTNTLPQSIRNAPKPEMVTKEFWEVVYWDEGDSRDAEVFATEDAARAFAFGVQHNNLIIRKLPPAEYKVIRKDGV